MWGRPATQRCVQARFQLPSRQGRHSRETHSLGRSDRLMNSDQPARRRFVAAAAAAAALLGALTLLTACGSSSRNQAASTEDLQQTALAYARCMRDNGVPD